MIFFQFFSSFLFSFLSILNIPRTIMALSGNPDRGITESDKIPDLHGRTTGRTDNENNSIEDPQGSENGPIVRSEDQIWSPGKFPRLSGSDRKPGPLCGPASDFWSHGMANVKAPKTRANGKKRPDGSTAIGKVPGNPPAERNPAESAPTRSKDQLHQPKLPSLKPDSSSATSSRVKHQSPPVPNSSISAEHEVPNSGNKPISPPLRDPPRVPTPDVAEPDQLLEHETNKCRSSAPASVSSPPNESRDGKGSTKLEYADAMPSRTECLTSPVLNRTQIEDTLPIRSATGKSEPAIPTGPRLKTRNPFHFRRGLGLSGPQRSQTRETPSKAPQAPQYKILSRVKAISSLSEPRSGIPIAPDTPINSLRIGHSKSLSAEAQPFHPSPPSDVPNTPTKSYRNGHDKSVSIESRHSEPSYESFRSKTPYGQLNIQHPQQTSMGTPPIPTQLGFLETLAASPQPPLGYHYPGPHQHTPEWQGQCFDTSRSIPLPSSVAPDGSPLPSSFLCLDKYVPNQNAQVYQQGEQNAEYSQSNHFDSYATSQAANAAPNAADLHQNGNMYTQDSNGYGPGYYSNHTNLAHQARLCPPRIDHAMLIMI